MPTLIQWFVAGSLLAVFVSSSHAQAFRALRANGGAHKARGPVATSSVAKTSPGAPLSKRATRKFFELEAARMSKVATTSASWTILPNWASFGLPPVPVVPEAVPVPEETSILKGSGVNIGWSGSNWASSRTLASRTPLESSSRFDSSAFQTRRYEMVAAAQATVAEAEPVEVPTATFIPGKPGFVELSFDPRGLPYVDVRGVEPGSEVQIVDPLDPEKVIRFRVPKREDLEAKGSEDNPGIQVSAR